jgi:SNF2 family DNA or RNA helicase
MDNNKNEEEKLYRPCLRKQSLLKVLKPEILIDKNVKINSFISSYLKDYQIEGIRFLYEAYKENRGCILADDMGLGKTIQVISFIAAILNKTGYESDLNYKRLDCIKKQLKLETNRELNINAFLIICPASLLLNWLNEINTWGYFHVAKYHGSHSNRQQTLNKIKNNRCEIVLTTHETCRDHIEVLSNLDWSAIIVDEFHKLKNDESQISQAFSIFKTKIKIGISGTVLQNNLTELWALLDW